MSEFGGPCCACLSVAYEPIDLDGNGGMFRERWRCTSCGAVFVRDAVMAYAITEAEAELADMTAQARALRAAAQGFEAQRLEQAKIGNELRAIEIAATIYRITGDIGADRSNQLVDMAELVEAKIRANEAPE